ncbi:MAG TPA: acyl-CoA dehydrogenase family protein [Dokdonella sp.]|uniref:acyl-CoA dehydrogenase family protein n=1 Tax=Dokdonella sp. TaxID=2291710 RepID=UPI002BE725CF|nr:acyl-CoA dehydrogenase family protein [Dokdonella sp.]HNV08671.1 acyl-CoA dehydrogenase family protein [Dokdonella sp.]
MNQHLPQGIRNEIDADLDALGAHAAQAWEEARARTPAQPILTHFDAVGNRIDRIESTPVWQRGAEIATRYGLVAAGHEARHGEYARCNQLLRVYLHHIASEFYTCPLAMTDGAATALKASANDALIAHAVPRLTSRDVSTFWLSGQWMTELAGGSDVGNTETEAWQDGDGHWRLTGRKWFTSAVVGDMALTLARPRGAGPGGHALAMFYLETHAADGSWNGIRIDQLKDKLGTRELATAEIHLQGARATAVAGIDHGVRLITPMLNITRTWNAVGALASIRRCVALATAYAHQREAFGKRLIEHPLHAETLADMQATFEAAFQLVFHLTHLLGRSECGLADADEQACLRLLTPLAKLWTGKLAVGMASECCEAFGGAGYIENTGIPQLLRDAQVYPIWEGTSNVLALDTLRALGKTGVGPILHCVERCLQARQDSPLPEALATAASDIRGSLLEAARWLETHGDDSFRLQAGARALAFSLARAVAAALLWRCAVASHAAGDARPGHALLRFLSCPLSHLSYNAFAPAFDLLDPA